MSSKPSDIPVGGGGGSLLLGDMPVEYWVRSFINRLPSLAERNQILGILGKYDSAGYSVTPVETQQVLLALVKIAASLDGI